MPQWRFIEREDFEAAMKSSPKDLHREDEGSLTAGIFTITEPGTVRSKKDEVIEVPKGLRVALLDEPKPARWCYFAEKVTVRLGGQDVEVRKGTPLFAVPFDYTAP
jgi:hypothetical protein